jgi:ATP synthase protein I
MTKTKKTSTNATQGDQDPWAAFGYLVAGVAFYGVLGWLVGRWLHADYLVAVGIVVGMLFGMYMVFSRYRFHDDGAVPTKTPIDNDSRATRRDDRDDRGDTQ